MKNIKTIRSTYHLFVSFQEVQKDRTTSTTFLFGLVWFMMGLFSSVFKAYTQERESCYLPLYQLSLKDFVTLPAKEH